MRASMADCTDNNWVQIFNVSFFLKKKKIVALLFFFCLFRKQVSKSWDAVLKN